MHIHVYQSILIMKIPHFQTANAPGFPSPHGYGPPFGRLSFSAMSASNWHSRHNMVTCMALLLNHGLFWEILQENMGFPIM